MSIRTSSINLHSDGPFTMKIEGNSEQTTVWIDLVDKQGPCPSSIFFPSEHMDRFTRATAAFNAAMSEEAPVISEAAE